MKFRKLRGKMAENGITQKALAEALGITQVALCDKLNGRREFKLREVRTVCIVLGISPGDIAFFFDIDA